MRYSFFGIVIIALLFLSCTQQGLPYLLVSVQEEYSTGNVTIPYTFQSEYNQQKCRIVISKKSYPDDEIVIDEELWLDREGELEYNLEAGFYTLQFTVLSRRGGEFFSLEFLDRTYSFSVSNAGEG